MMGLSTDLLNAPKEFLELFKAGKIAARRGDRAQAHEMFRRAVEIDPYHEQVWLWLASVVETDADKQVCFENVLQLNPANPTARHQLQRIAEKEAVAEVRRRMSVARQPPERHWMRRVLFVLVLSMISVALIVALGVML